MLQFMSLISIHNTTYIYIYSTFALLGLGRMSIISEISTDDDDDDDDDELQCMSLFYFADTLNLIE